MARLEGASARRRYGYRRLTVLLQREGWDVNHKRIYRLYRKEDLGVRTKKRKKRSTHLRVVPQMPTAADQRWCMDFVYDRLETGHYFRALNVLDVFTRECLTIHVDRKLTGAKVASILDGIAAMRGYPKEITVDNGTEFFSRAMDAWAHGKGVRLDFIRPGRPTENGFIESFNGRFRNECLQSTWFTDLDDARRVIEAWRNDYNDVRPHGSLDGRTPSGYERDFTHGPPSQVA